MKLTIATCQFPVDSDIRKNLKWIQNQMRTAKKGGAHIVHFSETCLAGCAGLEFESFEGFDWDLQRQCIHEVMDLAKRLQIWVIVGSNHQLSDNHKPLNSLYVINDCGQLVDRYDKRFCTGNVNELEGDLEYYSPGDHPVIFKIRGVVCGLAICHEMRYPELYREYKRQNVQLVFHSYHNSFSKEKLHRVGNPWGIVVPAIMQAYAATNYMWISATNTSTPETAWASFFVSPEGFIRGKLKNNRPGVLITTIDPKNYPLDPLKAWHDRALSGIYYSGTLVKDKRSKQRQIL